MGEQQVKTNEARAEYRAQYTRKKGDPVVIRLKADFESGPPTFYVGVVYEVGPFVIRIGSGLFVEARGFMFSQRASIALQNSGITAAHEECAARAEGGPIVFINEVVLRIKP